ncbi:hypothetical protein PHYBOEH_005003 [Phytophthora boehmeriae]|uniref:Uncharacterized protein n=1 Tax=Phytophthora boehmeriae TaxID=109152 RepID=A0A8T1WMJ3_9STRA|nr:hypothetical protein PHYBOEH_005003 [Phytophthora boehmeriae]
MATLLDTTMETLEDANDNQQSHASPQTDAPEDDEEDEDFQFNAPSYYDLKNPSLERRYVNNADGYFSSPAPSNATSKASPFAADQASSCPETSSAKASILTSLEPETETPAPPSKQSCTIHYETGNNHSAEQDGDAHMEDTDKNMLDTTMVDDELSRSLLDDRPETFEEVFRHYASSSQSSATSSYLVHELDTSTHSGVFSPHSSQNSTSSAALRAGRAGAETMSDGTRSVKGRFSGDGVSSKLMQPTQSYLRRLQAEQYMREQTFMEDVPVEEKPHRVTKPRSPKLHSRARPTNPNDPSRMSSTSRELLKIQEERLHLQLEKLKIREFHEKTKAQRPPTNVHQRSTKQLTIPQSPHFKVDNRARRFHSSASESSVGSSVDSESGHEIPRPPIAAETLLSRDYSLPLPPHPKENRHALTVRLVTAIILFFLQD